MAGMTCKLGTAACYFAVCKEAGQCMGESCPKDGAMCALASCVKTGDCQHAFYYDDDKVPAPSASTSETKTVTPTPATIKGPAVPVVKKAAKPCHVGMRHIVSMESGLELWIGGEKDVDYSSQTFDLLISLKGPPKYGSGFGESIVSSDARSAKEFPSELFPKPALQLYVDWPDFGVPRLSAEWWHTLVTYLLSKPMRVAMFCQGGHGRTGTATAILLSLFQVVESGDCPVLTLRDEYCNEVVESHEQIAYIKRITGHEVLAAPSQKGFGGWSDDDDDDPYNMYPLVKAAISLTPTPQMSKTQENKLRKKLALSAAKRVASGTKGDW